MSSYFNVERPCRISRQRSSIDSIGCHGLTGRQNVLRCVVIAVMSCATAGAIPRPDVQRQLVYDVPTVRAGFATGEPAVNLDEQPTRPLGLVGQLPRELGPALFTDSAGEVMVFHHIRDREILHHDDLVLINEAAAEFVQEIGTSIRYPGMGASQFHFGLAVVGRPLLFSRQVLLRPLHSRHVNLGGHDLFSGGQGSERRDTKVETHGVVDHGQFLFWDFAHKGGPPATVGGNGDRHTLWGAGEGAVPVDPEGGVVVLGQIEFLIDNFEHHVVVSCRPLTIPTLLEPGILGLFLKESSVRVLDITKRVEEAPSDMFVEPSVLGVVFEAGQAFTQFRTADAIFVLCPLTGSLRKSPIVHKTASTKLPEEELTLLPVRFNLVLK